MDIAHDTLVWFSKSWGLFYLLALVAGVLAYTFWPGNRKDVHRGQEEHPRRGRHPMEVERDPVSGHRTTGHDWNGIKELDTPVPRGVLMFLVVTHVFAVLWWFLMPAWPLGTTYTKGLLGTDQHQTVEERDQGSGHGAVGLDGPDRSRELRRDPG